MQIDECPRCNSPLVDSFQIIPNLSTKMCPSCGVDVVVKSPIKETAMRNAQDIICPVCGGKGGVGGKFCSGCGVNLERETKVQMRSAQDIHSMIDYFTARGGCDADISILRWVLGETKSEGQMKYEQTIAEHKQFVAYTDEQMRLCGKKLAEQDAEIRRLKSEPDHK